MIIKSESLDEAIAFVRRITEGNNPVTDNVPVLAADLLNHHETLRNAFFILAVLNSIKQKEMINKSPEDFPEEVLEKFSYKRDAGIKSLLKQIYSHVESENVEKLTPQMAGNWLKEQGYISVEYDTEKNCKTSVPTEAGIRIGLYSKARDYQGRRFTQVYYSRPAQEFIVAHFMEILHSR